MWSSETAEVVFYKTDLSTLSHRLVQELKCNPTVTERSALHVFVFVCVSGSNLSLLTGALLI